MAHLKTDFHSNNENNGLVNLPPSKSLEEATRKHTIKKHALGDLQNVIHNQCLPKGEEFAEVPGKSIKEYDACKQRNKQLHEASARQETAETSTPPTSLEDDGFEMLNYFDFDRKCCRKPYKSERQIWAEMDAFDDAMLDDIIQNTFAGDDERSHDDGDDHLYLDRSDDDILDISRSKFFPAVFPDFDDDGSDDILLPAIELENFDFS